MTTYTTGGIRATIFFERPYIAPGAALNTPDLCPGSTALDKINASLR
jgi:hypothetical protein